MNKNDMKQLKDEYGTNEPIFLSDFPNYEKESTRQYVSRAMKKGTICQYEKGVYYFPEETKWGRSLLSPWKVCEKKYIRSNGQTYGYVSGTSFENQIGLTTQMPNAVTIRTNNTAGRSRTIKTGGQTVILKKPRTVITNGNQKELQFLDMVNDLSEKAFIQNIGVVKAYCRKAGLSKDVVKISIGFYPDKTSRRIIEGGIYDILA